MKRLTSFTKGAAIAALALGSTVVLPAAEASAHGLFRAYQVCSSDHGTTGQFGPWKSSGVSTTASCGWTVTYRQILGDDTGCGLIGATHYTVAVC